MRKPLVSVIISTYKRRKQVKNAVKSVLNQTYDDIEIIVVNSDPRIKIEEILNGYDNIKCINQSKDKGASSARNVGINMAQGKYIAFLDDDDLFLPEKIEKHVTLMESLSGEYVGAYSWCLMEDKKTIIKSYREGDFTYELLSLDRKLNICGASSLFLRTSAVRAIGGFDPSFQRHQDWEFLLRLLEVGKLKMIKEPLFIKNGFNTPPPREYLEYEKYFLYRFSDLIQAQGKMKARKIYSAHWLKIANHFIKEGKIIEGLEKVKRTFKYAPPFQPLVKYLGVLLSLFSYLTNQESLLTQFAYKI